MTRRARRKVEAVLALLAFPVAVALTVMVIVAPASSEPAPSEPNSTGPAAARRVAIVGTDPVVAFALADSLTGAGYDVVSVQSRENSLGDGTEVVYYQRADRAEAERLRDRLGGGTIRRDQVFSPSADLTIHIGKDLQST